MTYVNVFSPSAKHLGQCDYTILYPSKQLAACAAERAKQLAEAAERAEAEEEAATLPLLSAGGEGKCHPFASAAIKTLQASLCPSILLCCLSDSISPLLFSRREHLAECLEYAGLASETG